MFFKFKKLAIPIFLFLMGLFIGVYIANRSEAYFPKNDLENLAKHSDYAYEAYQRGNIEAANTALLALLGQLDAAIKSNEAHSKAQHMDKMLTFGRLALLNQNTANEGKYMDLAIGICKELKREECSDASILKLVKHIDELHRPSRK